MSVDLRFNLKLGGFLARLIVSLALLSLSAISSADVVKPALIEISVFSDGRVEIEVRTSIEAMLTGIAGKYRNTQEAPNAEEYDALRVLSAENLRPHFETFQPRFVDALVLRFDEQRIPLSVESASIPEPGYTKVPRTSIIRLTGTAPLTAKQVTWYFPLEFGDNAVRLRQVNEQREEWHWSAHQWLRKDQVSKPFELGGIVRQRPISEVVPEYIGIGFDHIVPVGVDHILFILGIFLLSARFKPLLWQVTMFTIAHTITLGLSMSGWLSMPERIVEPLIALSIAYVGIENLFAHRLKQSRLVLVFLFGLLHGMGFAQALSDFGMPDHAFLTALISFNIGVEFGQLAVLAAAFLTIGLWFRSKDWYYKAVVVPASLSIGVVGLIWFVDRLQLFA